MTWERGRVARHGAGNGWDVRAPTHTLRASVFACQSSKRNPARNLAGKPELARWMPTGNMSDRRAIDDDVRALRQKRKMDRADEAKPKQP